MKRNLFLGLMTFVFVLSAQAYEGMWMLNRIDQKTAEVMKELGLQLTPLELYNPEGISLKDAVVDFGDFCSGVVVSPKGLVFTNHHCGYGAIQKLSTPEDDILANGFVARSYEEERPAEGLFVRFLERTEECSGTVMRGLDRLYRTEGVKPSSPREKNVIDSICTAIEKDYEKQYPGTECMVRSYYGGNAYFVSVYKVYRDIRLVFTATETLGKFGGDTDNWMWPRQTCDFSVFRIYADKDGNPAEYSEDNVPYTPKHYAKVSIDGYEPGSYCMTIGYPGSTSRYLSSWGIDERVNVRNIPTIQVRGLKQSVWKKWMDADRAVALKYASKWASSSNYWKNSIGMNKAIAELDVIGQKKQLEKDIRLWYSKREDLTRRFGKVFETLSKGYAERKNDTYAAGFFRETFMSGIEIYTVANALRNVKKDMDEKAKARLEESLERFFKNYEPKLDEETMGVLLKNYREQIKDKKYWPDVYSVIDEKFAGDCMAYAKDLFARTVCTDMSCINKVLADSTLLETDPAILYAATIPAYMRKQAAMSANAADLAYNERMLTQALLEMDQENPHYSDANFTMRLSYGIISAYTSQGNQFNYYTDAQSLLDKVSKQNEIEDYKLEDDIVKLLKEENWGRYADKKTGDMHLCFISDNDITGGNSGSPMFNGKGELIGLAFDGNWEAMSGDISFDKSLQRCIGVDIRYVLYLMEKWGGADNLIKELGY